ncbi:hypothetical protein IIA16_06285, partial [bacterium]|nr:hypothetical protein [bacterium]
MPKSPHKTDIEKLLESHNFDPEFIKSMIRTDNQIREQLKGNYEGWSEDDSKNVVLELIKLGGIISPFLAMLATSEEFQSLTDNLDHHGRIITNSNSSLIERRKSEEAFEKAQEIGL